MTLPLLFSGIAAALLLFALFAFWQSLRTALGVVAFGSFADDEAEDRANLLLLKDALLRSLQDLRDEHEAGKISEADFKRQNASLRAQAAEVLKALDEEVEPYRAKADRLIAAALKKAGVELSATAEGSKAEQEASSEPAPAAESDARPACASCGTTNDPDALFCKHCAAPLGKSESSGEKAPAGNDAGNASSEADEPLSAEGDSANAATAGEKA